MKMNDLEVSVRGGNIYIQQQEFGQNNPNSIEIYPEQVELLINWLNEAKEEAVKSKNK
jgi:hypothetical protein